MDWKIFSTTFITIFLAEIGDKTQFAAFAAASQTRSLTSVLLATILALALAGTLGVIFGNFLGQFIDPKIMKIISGFAFILMGAWILSQKSM
jgi:putative Ca2+/H+ antiporter (TMEM165/GDT1 family)